MINLNTNISSIIAQRSLTSSSKLLNQAIERMSTGAKLNHASDNAANYSISTNMTTRIGAYQVAEDNVAMGLDMLTTASDSLDLISDKFSRLRALAEQAANGTYGKQSLMAINTEAQALVDEIYRIKVSAEYNGQKLYGSNPIDDGIVGAKDLEVNSEGFLRDVERQDTSKMTSFESVDPNQAITSGKYSISTAQELKKLADMTNAKKISGGELVLANNIDLSEYSSGEGWTPIGKSYDIYFSGIFDGNGYEISNLYINSTDPIYNIKGLFGHIANAEVKNLAISGEINGQFMHAASISGIATGSFKVENCYGKVDIQVDNKNNTSVGGGIIGTVANNVADYDGVIDYCYSTGDIEAYDIGGVLGIAGSGMKSLIISNSYATGDINAKRYAGGILANSDNKINILNCFATGNVYANLGCAGGLAGRCGGVIKNSHATGNVHGNYVVGGFIGDCASGLDLVENCYSTGNVTSSEGASAVAGFIATLDVESGSLKNCHTTSKVVGCGKNSSFVSVAIDGYKFENCSYNGADNKDIAVLFQGSNSLESVYDVTKGADYDFQVGINSSESSSLYLNTFYCLEGLRSLPAMGLGSDKALNIIDEFLNKVSAKQTKFGAMQNRLESALEEINTQYENLASSHSTIKDADVAKVSSEYIRQQILQQASATLLSTANQAPNLALQLL